LKILIAPGDYLLKQPFRLLAHYSVI